MSREHAKFALGVSLCLYPCIDGLGDCENKFVGETLSESEIATLAPLGDNDLFWADQVSTESLQVFGLLGLHRSRICDMVDKIELECALHGHPAQFFHLKLIMPSGPNAREPLALLRLEVFELIVVAFTEEFEEEGFMRSGGTLFVVWDLCVVPDEVVHEMFKGHAREVALKEFVFVVIWLPDVLKSGLQALGIDLLVL